MNTISVCLAVLPFRQSGQHCHLAWSGPGFPRFSSWKPFPDVLAWRFAMTLATIPAIGEIFSAVSAILWALSLVLFRRAGDSMGPATLNLYKGLVAMVCLVPTMLILGVDMTPANVTWKDWVMMLGSGMVGMGIADTILFIALNKVGPTRYAIINCAYGPVVILMSVLWLDEPFSWLLILSAALMVAAILTSVLGRDSFRRRTATGDAREKVLRYYLAGVLGVSLIAVSIVIAKPILNRTDGVWGAFARLCGGLMFLIPQGLMPGNLNKTIAALKPGPHHRTALLPSFLGAYLCTVLWTLGMKYTWASTASVLTQLTNIMLFPFAALILKERLQAKQFLAVLLGISAGMLLILTR